MQSQIVFLLKILLLSAIVSLFIKYVMPYFTIAPTDINAAIAVFIPPIVVGFLLLWRDRQEE
ncbi:MAG: hypothetical protein AAGA60_27405 [Cyanobacteria bacterium P01_E01_bin.42]